MAAMHTYPVLNISETYIRQSIYDSLPESVRAEISFEDFRGKLNAEDYRHFASALSDLINDYVVEHDLFAEFVAQAVQETMENNETLSRLYMSRDISNHDREKKRPE
jgi:hypothetical protein